MTDPIVARFFVDGTPRPQGSKTAFPIYRKGANGEREFTGHSQVTDASKKLKPWRESVKQAAREAYDGAPFAGPVEVHLVFFFSRPKKHFRTGKYANQLRDDAPRLHIQKPDLSKITRAVEDAIKDAGVWKDDSQVCMATKLKVWGDRPGVSVVIRRLQQ
jgi:crossover junction endodeoxyribonuclease RusA